MTFAKKFTNKESEFSEQTLLDEIAAVFGPHIEDISITQDLYRVKNQPYSTAPFLPAALLSMEQISVPGASSSDDNPGQYVVTAQVPREDPRIHIGKWFHLHWLRELKIVFRVTNKRPFFLHSQSMGVQGSSLLVDVPKVVDFTLCKTLEYLLIEDLDRNGRPQRLRRQQALEKVEVVPFDQYQGVKLPANLKSFEMVGLSANVFNFGWLRSTPGLERLQILGKRRQMDSKASNLHTPLWHWDDFDLLSLKHLAIHHSPAFYFRFDMLNKCQQLESLDIRDISLDAFRVYGDNLFSQSSNDVQDSALRFENLKRCRLEVLMTPGLSMPVTTHELDRVLQTYFMNVTQLHLDGIPENALNEATKVPHRLELITKRRK
ncbi:hypothetical protein BGZ49_000147 [Haplosporangium sp. Z 27]|nr:hypothetical protein BGZ49_000147 [Haplosporangium sp. Z 27]